MIEEDRIYSELKAAFELSMVSLEAAEDADNKVRESVRAAEELAAAADESWAVWVAADEAWQEKREDAYAAMGLTSTESREEAHREWCASKKAEEALAEHEAEKGTKND